MAGIAQALQVRGFKHAQRGRTMFLHAPAELFFHHEAIEQHHIRRQFVDERVKTAVVQLDWHFANAQRREVGPVLTAAGRAAEGDIPTLLQESLKDLHHVATGCGGAGLGPDVTNDQDAGCARLTHVRGFLEACRGRQVKEGRYYNTMAGSRITRECS